MKQSWNRVKAEENPTITKTRKKMDPPEHSHDTFEKPQNLLRRHIQEFMKGPRPLQKKSENKTGISWTSNSL